MKLRNFYKKHKKILFRLSLIFLFSLLLSLIPYPNKYFLTVAKTVGLGIKKEIKLPDPPSYPVNISSALPSFLSAQSVYIADLPSGAVIYDKNSKDKLPPASTTKIVTALVGMDYFKMDDVLKVKEAVKEGKTMGLINGEELTFESLLYGTLVHSANDAAFAIAQNYEGGVDNFVKKMNEKIESLGLTDTHFTNPAGLDDPNQYTTARDLSKLARIALKNNTFSKIVSTRSITVSDINYTLFHDLKNVNELLGKVPGVAGVKTGFTENGGEILISEVKKNGHNILIALLRSQDRFGETESLINWVFNNFEWKDIKNVTPATPGRPQEDTPQSYYLPQKHK